MRETIHGVIWTQSFFHWNTYTDHMVGNRSIVSQSLSSHINNVHTNTSPTHEYYIFLASHVVPRLYSGFSLQYRYYLT